MRNNDVRRKTVLVRDLMKPVYVFGRLAKPGTCVDDLSAALERLRAGRRFYVRAGGGVVYEVSPQMYRSIGIPHTHVARRLKAVFALG